MRYMPVVRYRRVSIQRIHHIRDVIYYEVLVARISTSYYLSSSAFCGNRSREYSGYNWGKKEDHLIVLR